MGGSVTGEGQDPLVVLLGEEDEAARPAGLRAHDDHPVAAERSGRQSQPSAGVLDVDRQALVPHARESERLQPGGHLGGAAGGADDEVRLQRALHAVECDPYAGHAPAAAARHEVERLAPLDELDAGQRADAPAHVGLDERPAGQDRPHPRRGARHLEAIDDPPQLLEHVARGRARRDQLGVESGEQ